jgi:hypothetical protein
MHIAIFTTFAASKKEPLVEMVERVYAAFVSAGLGEPLIRFILADHADMPLTASLGIKRVSSIERVLKRWPELERFVRSTAPVAGPEATHRVLANRTESGSVERLDFTVVREIARGVPKSFPFQKAAFHFSAPGFSEGPEPATAPDRQTLAMLMRAGVDIGAGQPTAPGISVQDSWWVNGRERSLSAMRIIEGDPSAKKLPPPPANIAQLLAACGKVRKTVQVPMQIAAPPVAAAAASEPARATAAASEKGEAIRAVVRTYRARLPALLDRLPHDIPQQETEPAPLSAAGLPTSGPKKPVLVEAFAPLGYDCKGGTGTFTLRRRTPGNLTVKLDLDVGTWSHSIMAFMKVEGMIDGQGFKATLNLPVSPSAVRGVVHGAEIAGQFPIGGPERWKQIVENLAALVGALDRSFVPEVEAAAGPSPEWYRASA